MTLHTAGPTVLAVIIVLASFSTLAVGCRIYARYRHVRNSGIDDYMIIIALFFTLAMTTGIGLQVRYGLGLRQSAIDPRNSESMLKCFWASIWLYHLGIGFTRLSIILLVMRIFPQAAFGWVRWALCYGLLALNTLTMAWATLSCVFMCDPISAFWTTDIAGTKCWARSVVWLINSTLGMFLDFSCAVLPLPWIKGLQLRRKQKILVMGIFVLAGLPCLLAVIRLHSLIIVADSLDPAYDNGTLATFSATEIHVGITHIMYRIIATITASLALNSHAHLFINSPAPINGTAVKPPLDPSGSDFPCHGISLPSTRRTKMAAGSQQLLSFELGANGTNTAVHGGGSCQMAITYETDTAKLKNPSSWKVIYSIEGGCPSDAQGNLDGVGAKPCGNGNEPNCVNQFKFNIPKGVKNAHAIMAWTIHRWKWLRDGIPDMFVGNLASVNQCPTKESINLKFPKPGKYATTKTEGSPYPLALPTGQGCAGGGGDGGGSSADPPAQTSSAAAAPPSQAPAPSQPAPSSQAPAPSAAPAPSQGAGICTDGTVPCPTPGQIICIGTTKFGTCDIDHCAVPQAVAPGTTCKAGKITKRRKRALESHKRKFKHGRLSEG
ncbi:lytic polysaccharide monooxygenase [Zasmidium cellare ATCC 36951]|uniref:Lytic polysaccharide monooxygenase n=1 Tax=Zasmidium cellare ATCC 36951 TaxID=1080233 RepID=A0A6A6CBM8_ZASCE|nr:lytic polysaccharide monooxygenase [Zasmidium cellare ATCC 36951]KAF2163608.1 lytic polysaccharide monooxygenase [Zasmidium cellare ATCC 36951]